jgi:3-(3-hydroxy-phenyl)propionate hydroxylase
MDTPVTDARSSRSSDTLDYEIAIVGYGPTGVTLANFLGRFGIRTLVVERARDIYSRARAVTVDGKTLRQFQALGLDELLKADMDVTPAVRWKTYDNRELLRTTFSTNSANPTGHASSYMIFQPKVEATLRAAVDSYAGTVDVHFGESFSSLEQDDSGVTLRTEHDDSGGVSSYRVGYVIGADGGSSLVRQALGVELEGTTRERLWIVIDAKVKRWWPERQILTFWSDPARPCVDVPLALDHHRWEFPLQEGESPEDFESDEAMWQLLAPLGIDGTQVEILHKAFYNHHVRQAREWQVGRVLLAGDSAHMMPPWAGQGMQSGMRDAVNLAWKLRAVLRFGVDDALLQSYQIERQPNVTSVTNQSIGIGRLIEIEATRAQRIRNRLRSAITSLRGARRADGVRPELYAGFLTGTPSGENAIGKTLPQPHIATQTGHRILLDEILGLDFAVIGLDIDPRSVMSSDEAAGWDRLGARFVTLRSSQARPDGDDDIVDFEEVLEPWFRKYGAKVIVVRPDRFVAATDSTGLQLPPGTSFVAEPVGALPQR